MPRKEKITVAGAALRARNTIQVNLGPAAYAVQVGTSWENAFAAEQVNELLARQRELIADRIERELRD